MLGEREIPYKNECKANKFDDAENNDEVYNPDDNLDVLRYAIGIAIAANDKSINISTVNGNIMLNIYPYVNDKE